jgi:hypothetical protein
MDVSEDRRIRPEEEKEENRVMTDDDGSNYYGHSHKKMVGDKEGQDYESKESKNRDCCCRRRVIRC